MGYFSPYALGASCGLEDCVLNEEFVNRTNAFLLDVLSSSSLLNFKSISGPSYIDGKPLSFNEIMEFYSNTSLSSPQARYWRYLTLTGPRHHIGYEQSIAAFDVNTPFDPRGFECEEFIRETRKVIDRHNALPPYIPTSSLSLSPSSSPSPSLSPSSPSSSSPSLSNSSPSLSNSSSLSPSLSASPIHIKFMLGSGLTGMFDVVMDVFDLFPYVITGTLAILLLAVSLSFRSVVTGLRLIFTIAVTLSWSYGAAHIVFDTPLFKGTSQSLRFVSLSLSLSLFFSFSLSLSRSVQSLSLSLAPSLSLSLPPFLSLSLSLYVSLSV